MTHDHVNRLANWLILLRIVPAADLGVAFRVAEEAKMTAKEQTSFDALRDAFEAAPEASKAEFLEWLARWRLTNTQQSIAQLNPRARETWLEPLPWDDYE
jgi:hypothetical protein